MKHLTSALAVVLSLGLAACTPPAEAPADAPAPAAPVAAPDAAPAAPETPAEAPTAYSPREALLGDDGLTFQNPGGRGTGLHIAFGRPQATVIAILTGFRGAAPTVSRNEECGAGPLSFATWNDGLTLLFQDGVFAGWAAGDTPRGFTTDSGIGIGSTLAQLRAAHPGIEVVTDSLGPEFVAGEISGIASGTRPTATVTHLWAGVSCNFR